MQHPDVAAAVINYDTAALTVRCVESLLAAGIPRVLVLDNGSSAEDYARLGAALRAHEDAGVRLARSDLNLGFAAGCNRLIEEALRDPGCERVLLLNNDAVAVAGGLGECLAAMRAAGHALMGGRMHKLLPEGDTAQRVDSLGIAMYTSLLASNRMSVEATYLGPTGGFAVYSRGFLEEIRRLHGHVFDPDYFCYAEDTDLCVRARLLAFPVGYCDEIVAYHEGQGSHAGLYSEFILYHGIRNSIWTLVKSIPWRIGLTHLPWVLALHAGTILRHVARGEARTTFRLYRDAICGIPKLRAKRRVIKATRRIAPGDFRAYIDPHFYEPAFVRNALRELFGSRPA